MALDWDAVSEVDRSAAARPPLDAGQLPERGARRPQLRRNATLAGSPGPTRRILDALGVLWSRIAPPRIAPTVTSAATAAPGITCRAHLPQLGDACRESPQPPQSTPERGPRRPQLLPESRRRIARLVLHGSHGSNGELGVL
ncbi:hypothetical protein SO694_0001241 [Aureococcus anophagefferens]|uniref:Uncharacterized protein n=1 Tax=Aureococcus anophagefferens TaxID=44056 RepID=A0ABR1G244_AURAN